MGLLQDLLYGGKPKRWTDTQWRTFDENYSRMANGVFSWSDFKPPTNLAALTATIINLSLKSMISGGNRGLFAGYVDLLNREYLAGSRTSDIFFYTEANLTPLAIAMSRCSILL